MESRCDAVMQWQRAARFRRICPLLKETPDGWRCSVNAQEVRPFWGRALVYGAATLLGVYLVAGSAVFVTLRLTQHEISYFALVWPPRWKEIRSSQEKLYAVRAQQAMAAGRYQEAILSLEMVCRLNPRNYTAGLALASLSQVAANPTVTESIYERLLRDVPDQRTQTAQILFRNLLARSAYDKIKSLAAVMVVEDAGQRGTWLHALFFAARQTNDPEVLKKLLEQRSLLPEWCVELVTIEQALLRNRLAEVAPRLTRVYGLHSAPYVPYYQVDRLLRHGRPDDALNLLGSYGRIIPADEAAFLQLRVWRALGWKSLVDSGHEALLLQPMTNRLAAQCCAYLVGNPAPGLLAGYLEKFNREAPPLSMESLPLYHAMYLAADVAGNRSGAENIAGRIKRFTGTDARVLQGLVQLLATSRKDDRLSRILPLVPLPTEVVYAILERQPVAAAK